MDLMRKRHRYGDAQIQELFAHSRALADRYDDVNFTPPYLATITAETLIVFGDRDPLYPVSLGFELKAAIPRSHLWVIPNAGHAPVFGDGAPRFAETATSFLRDGLPLTSDHRARRRTAPVPPAESLFQVRSLLAHCAGCRRRAPPSPRCIACRPRCR